MAELDLAELKAETKKKEKEKEKAKGKEAKGKKKDKKGVRAHGREGCPAPPTQPGPFMAAPFPYKPPSRLSPKGPPGPWHFGCSLALRFPLGRRRRPETLSFQVSSIHP